MKYVVKNVATTSFLTRWNTKMPLYEVYATNLLIKADSEDEARQVYVDLVSGEVTSEFIFVEEVEE